MRSLFRSIKKTFKEKLKGKDASELLKGSFLALIVKVLGMLLGYLIMIIITRSYGAEIYGEYALAFTVLNIAVLLPKFGLDSALVRIIGELKANDNYRSIVLVMRKAFLITSILGLILAILLFFFSESLAIKIFNNYDLVPVFSIIKWLLIPYAGLYLIAAYFQAYKKIIYYILFNSTLLNIVFFITLLIFKLINYHLQPFYTLAISIVIAFLIGFVLLKINISRLKGSKNTTSNVADNFSFKKMITLSSPMLMSSSFVLLINWSDILMLGMFTTEFNVGIYNAALRLATISGITLFAINAISTPKFVEYYTQNNLKGLENTVRKSTMLIFYSTLPMLLVFIFFSKNILNINGPEFTSGYLTLTLLCLGRFYNSICGSVGFILQMTDNQKIFQNVLFLAAVINVTLNFFLIPKYGINGAAFASLVTVVIWNSILVLIIKKKLGFWTIYLPFVKK